MPGPTKCLICTVCGEVYPPYVEPWIPPRSADLDQPGKPWIVHPGQEMRVTAQARAETRAAMVCQAFTEAGALCHGELTEGECP